jgi:heterotetrameric sarcosine oxidase alpha subunit
MTQDFRNESGGRIDRTRKLTFTFDGKSVEGFEGDTLASALLANGIRLVGRSFKYHRPRGILSAGPEEPNALVELREGAAREPNTRATTVEIFEGLAARSQNRFPSLAFDMLSVTGLLSPIFAAGFYYKTFMWPAAFWERVYEPLIRRAAGLGRASGLPDPDSYDKQTAFADVLIIGGGPAGFAAALDASADGAEVILVEQDFALGGRLLSDRRMIDGKPASAWLADKEGVLRARKNVRVLTRTTITGAYDGGTYAGVERVCDHLAAVDGRPRQRLWRIVAPQAVLATGAIERPLVFGGNDLPGVMLAGAVRSYINRFAVRPGARAVVFTNNDDGASTVGDLIAAGIEVAALVDTRAESPGSVRALAGAHDIPILAGSYVRRAVGGIALKHVILGGAAGEQKLHCDLLVMSGGWNPLVHLGSHHGGKPVWNEALSAFLPGPMPPGMRAAGAAAGVFLLADILHSAADGESDAVTPFWQNPHGSGKAFVDFQNDVTQADLALAAREGFTAVEHLKRYTTLGMATDQGKTSNVTGLAIMAALTHRTIPQTGTTVFRPPYTPVAIGAFVGPHRGVHWRPTRRTPAHGWAERQKAVFVEAGDWMRAAYFPHPGENTWQESVTREVRRVRQSVGFCDVTTLGKIDVQGPDAGKFLDFIYANMISTLAPGRVRYALMLREDGFAFDDGTVARLAPQHFVLTTTTANAARVLRHMDFCAQILHPELDVIFEPITDQWAQFALAGPKAREVLQKLAGEATDVSNAGLAFMATKAATLCGVFQARLFRISFSGELAYEIAVPASQGEALAQALFEAGAAPYGLEALNVLRLEKGHPVGAELNGQTTAADLGMAGLLSKKKDFIGRVLSQRPALLEADRPSLVGLRVRGDGGLAAGAHLVAVGAAADAANDAGYVTSAAYSPSVGGWIGLGLLERGALRTGEILRAVSPIQGTDMEVEVVSRVFHDPEGAALHV